MKLLRFASLLALIALLSACSVTVRPDAFDVHSAVGVRDASFVNSRLSLRAYPGSTIVSQQERGGRSSTRFETGAGIETVFDHFDRQLSGQGWRRGDFELKRNKAEAEYRRGDSEIDLELHREGNSGGYRLDIRFDD